jgi:hypothetical protein
MKRKMEDVPSSAPLINYIKIIKSSSLTFSPAYIIMNIELELL